MSSYYTGRRAKHYNTRWRIFTRKTLTAAVAMIDLDALRRVPDQLGRPPHVLDVACGTGTLLSILTELVPDAEAYGVDASPDMLAQAEAALTDRPRVWLVRAEVSEGPTAGLPYAPGTFDLVTCTNTLHDIADPVAVLEGLGRLLKPGGQLVLEDFARRKPSFAWTVFEWLERWIEGGHGRAYTLAEAQALCMRVGLHVVCGKAFTIDWFWRGWALCANAYL